MADSGRRINRAVEYCVTVRSVGPVCIGPCNNAREVAASTPESWLNLFALLTPVSDQLMPHKQRYDG